MAHAALANPAQPQRSSRPVTRRPVTGTPIHKISTMHSAAPLNARAAEPHLSALL